jgi:hypothetical protein
MCEYIFVKVHVFSDFNFGHCVVVFILQARIQRGYFLRFICSSDCAGSESSLVGCHFVIVNLLKISLNGTRHGSFLAVSFKWQQVTAVSLLS